MTINLCMIGYGMMGIWHTEALVDQDVVLHTLVGRQQPSCEAFAQKYGYRNCTTSLSHALSDHEIDAVIIASPSQWHVDHAIACLDAGKHVLIEIPIAMSADDAQRIADLAATKPLVTAVCHPLRFRQCSIDLTNRIANSQETVLAIETRFLIHRYENVGATGYQRSWVDNPLWHHAAHLVDFAIWTTGDQNMSIDGWMSDIDVKTGIPMTVHIRGETKSGALISHLLSYCPRERVSETMVITDRDSYRIDLLRNTLTTGDCSRSLVDEQSNCARVTWDFVIASRNSKRPSVTAGDVMPAMRALQKVQDQWDRRYGVQALPGRPLSRL